MSLVFISLCSLNFSILESCFSSVTVDGVRAVSASLSSKGIFFSLLFFYGILFLIGSFGFLARMGLYLMFNLESAGLCL